MSSVTRDIKLSRRSLVYGLGAGAAALALPAPAFSSPPAASTANTPIDEILALTGGRMPLVSDRLVLDMPRKFANGFTVPMTITVESPMTAADHVRRVHVLAPGNPFLEVATFTFTPRCGVARVSTRIRLAEPQFVHALAELSDETFLLARTWVEVSINGCAG